MLVVWFLGYLCPSPIENLNSGFTGFQLYNMRGTQVIKDPHTDRAEGSYVCCTTSIVTELKSSNHYREDQIDIHSAVE